MSKSSSFVSSGFGIAIAVGLATAAAIVSCSPSPAPSSTGSVTISALDLSAGVTVDQVTYAITGNGITPLAGSIDVTNTQHATALVSGIPANASPYVVAMDATSTDHSTTCHGTGTFVVTANQTVMVSVVLQCRGPRNTTTGAVAINGGLDNCPSIQSFTATSLEAPVGGSITVAVTARDLDPGDTVGVQWTASPLGIVAIGNSAAAQTTITCTAVGATALSIAVTDGVCGDTLTGVIPVNCLTGSVSGTGGSGTGGAGTGGAGTGGAGVGGMGTGGMGAGGSGTGGSGTGGTGTGGTGTGGAGTGGAGGAQVCEALPTGAGALCSACTALSCQLAPNPNGTDGCCGLSSTADVALCVAAVRCYNTNAATCVVNGDPTKCYCGTATTTCFTTGGNGPCVAPVRAAAKSTDPATIRTVSTSPASPLGRANNLEICRGSFCPSECLLPRTGAGGAGGSP